MDKQETIVKSKSGDGFCEAFSSDILRIGEKLKQNYDVNKVEKCFFDENVRPLKYSKNHTVFESFYFAWQGLVYAFKHERNMRLHSIFAVAALIVGLVMRFSVVEMALLFLTITFVLILEIVNTALELTLDYTHGTSYQPLVKVIKDVVAGGVLLASVNALIVGAVLFFKHIYFSL